MARAPIPSRRFRISVPEKDEDVIAWFEEQEEISASIRVLVKNFVKKEGVVDVMCRSVDGPRQEVRQQEAKSIPKPQAQPSAHRQAQAPVQTRTIPKPQTQAVKAAPAGDDGFVDPESFFKM